ncbi:class I SAM-dependent methyltransferase [Pseudomonas sp. PGPR40]|uniref:class I SAM-dependent methyltransferase n=1 Tax=Pseudomonas sp. PGPR40 TaxID=2913476 RepID=UPI001EDC5810|nr:class I SAM-dependent methyltransferase [Pseudomonas sp. PGPR40]
MNTNISLVEILRRTNLPSFHELPLITLSNVNWADPIIGQAMLKFQVDPSTDQASRGVKNSSIISVWMSEVIEECKMASVLDLFSGLGAICLKLFKEGHIRTYLGVEINPAIVQMASTSTQDGARFLCSDIMSYLIKSDRLQFGLICVLYECLNAIGISNVKKLLGLIASKSKPGVIIAGDVRLRSSNSASLKVIQVLPDAAPPWIAGVNKSAYVLDEYGQTMCGKFYGHRYMAFSDSGKNIDAKHCLLELFDKDGFFEMLNALGFELISSKQLLQNQITDVPECRDNLFFAARLRG